MKYISLLLLASFVFLFSVIASAETGSLVIDAGTGNTWNNGAADTSSKTDFQNLTFDTANYNYLKSFVFKFYPDCSGFPCVTFAHQTETTEFNIVANGSGTGYFSYDALARNITLFCYGYSGCYITGSPVKLSFSTPQISNNISIVTFAHFGGSGYPVSTTKPVYFKSNVSGVNLSWGSFIHSETSVHVENQYLVTYRNETFNVEITKFDVPTKINVVDLYTPRQSYFQESNYNQISMLGGTSFTGVYGYGLGIYMNLSNGRYGFVYVNASGTSGIGTPTSTVTFTKPIYNGSEDIKINYNLISPDFTTKYYYLKFLAPSGRQILTYPLLNANGSWTPAFDKNEMGNYSVWMGYQSLGCGYFCYDTFLDEDYANYGNMPGSITGNLSVNKLIYNSTETMTIWYNTTTAGIIEIKQNQGMTSSRYLNAFPGTGKTANYIFGTGDELGNYTVILEYKDGNGNWIWLDSKTVTLVSQTGFIDTVLSSYFQGETVSYYYYAKAAGNVTVVDSNGDTKYYRSFMTGLNTRIDDSFYIRYSDLPGTWSIKLNDATGLVDEDTITVMSAVQVTTPTPTTPVTPGQTIDYVKNKSARKAAENNMLNSAYSVSSGLFMMAIMATMVYLMKKMRF